MTIYDTRRENLRRLIGTARGSMTALAVKTGMTKQQVSHIIGSNPVKNIGNEMARRIEQAYAIPIGQLDRNSELRQPAPDLIEIPTLQEAADLPAYLANPGVQRITVSKSWLVSNVAIPPEHAAIITVLGDAMAPTLLDGDVAIVDRSATRIDRDGIYVVARLSEIYILRVRRQLDGTLLFSADNQAYPPVTISNTIKDGLLTLGRVIMLMRPGRL